jgi:predicted GIY-YIG superfamily endonuclease
VTTCKIELANFIPTPQQMSTTIYILKLQGGKYYVGKSDNVLERIRDHTNGIGSAWTRKYKPIDVEKTIPNASPFAEDATVKEYMARYGIDNVRGGTYVTEHLSESEHHHLQQEIWAAKDCCKRCGRSGHFINTCHARTDVNGDEIDEEDEGSQDDNDSDDEDEDSDDYSEEEDSE